MSQLDPRSRAPSPGQPPPIAWPSLEDFEAAARLRDLLIAETGRPYLVRRDRQGFQLVRSPPGTAAAQATATAGPSPPQGVQAAARVLRPAWRNGWYHGLVILLSLALAVAAVESADPWLAMLLGERAFEHAVQALPLDPGLWAMGFCLLMASLSAIAWMVQRYSHRYCLRDGAIEVQTGLIARRTRRVNLTHIRSIGLEQSLWGRLFNVGHLEFASAGTGEIDIRWHGLRHPASIRQQVQNLIQAAQRPAGGET
ncbi:hypothetical protein M911_07850 [Ectothiorhodospira haloalkaliphila]|uniref:YdbS-like PH domain-containing protein n=2 Tax=Ectothiorhodospira haloalkaliphila TaxID=421628 RepID=W8KYR3_9GAMM|nr:PH domain-containing protein [Ectothiorhodospira haloalkaliphila]AHK80671.1 hypothetical protein M911_07850 [Ectothiorhodospira haloalkaliphila]